MSNKVNLSFFNAYIALDKICADRLGVKQNGVSSYINRLVDLRFAPGRSEVLPRLIKYRNCRNSIAHEMNAIRDCDEITKSDIKWINRFARTVSRRADPVAKYERKAGFYSLWRKVRAALIGAIIAVVGVAIYFLLQFLQII